MARQPFAWETQVGREILDDEISQVCDLPYTMWRAMIGTPMSRPVVGRDGRRYRLTLEAGWVRPGAIRVTLTLKPTGWRIGAAARDSFVVSSDGRVTRAPPAP